MNNLSFTLSNDEKLVKFNDNECSICLEKYESKDELNATPCSHIFHNKCIKQWLHEKTYCPKCKSDCTIEKLCEVTQLIYTRIITPSRANKINYAIEHNNINELIAIIEDFPFCENSVYLKQEFQQIIEQQDNSKLNIILENLLGLDSLSEDKYENIYNLFEEILRTSIEKITNVETIELLYSYNFDLNPEVLTILFNKYFQDRNFDTIITLIENNDDVMSINKNIMKKVIQEDINKNNKTEVEKALEVISILNQQEKYFIDISDIIIDLLCFVVSTDNNVSIMKRLIQLGYK